MGLKIITVIPLFQHFFFLNTSSKKITVDCVELLTRNICFMFLLTFYLSARRRIVSNTVSLWWEIFKCHAILHFFQFSVLKTKVLLAIKIMLFDNFEKINIITCTILLHGDGTLIIFSVPYIISVLWFYIVTAIVVTHLKIFCNDSIIFSIQKFSSCWKQENLLIPLFLLTK